MKDKALDLRSLFSLNSYKTFRTTQCKQPWLVKIWLSFDLNFRFTSSVTAILETRIWNLDQNKFQIHVLCYSYTRDESFPLNPYQSSSRKLYPRASRHINNSLTVHLFLNSEMQLCKSKELNNLGMKVQLKKGL